LACRIHVPILLSIEPSKLAIYETGMALALAEIRRYRLLLFGLAAATSGALIFL
jgi:hypothetical protein